MHSECSCSIFGAVNGTCNKVTGQCYCRQNRIGLKCDACAQNTYVSPAFECLQCDCNSTGSRDQQCANVTGNCLCNIGIGNEMNDTRELCNKCKVGFRNFSSSGCSGKWLMNTLILLIPIFPGSARDLQSM